METIIANKFKIIRKIDEGAFGEIFEGVDIKNGNQLALKLQKTVTKYPQLLLESKIMTHLHSDSLVLDRGIPQIHYAGTQGEFNILGMQLLGPSLESLHQKAGGLFSLKTTLLIADQLFKRLEYVHSRGVLHRDVKPDNFLLGKGPKQKKIYVIDFGLAKYYLKKGKHIPYQDDKPLIGTVRYASVNLHMGIEATRRDDLESVVYMLVYFLYGSLPWQGIKAVNKKDKMAKILSKKLQNQPQVLMKNLPPEFTLIMQHIRQLKYEEKPNYELLRNHIKDCIHKNNLEYDYNYDWSSNTKDKKAIQK